MARMKLSFGERKELRQRLQVNERSVVKHSRIDEAVRDRLTAKSDKFAAAQEATPEIKGQPYTPMPDINADVFYSHIDLDADVQVREASEVVPSSAPHTQVMESFVRQEDFEATHNYTRGDDTLSAVATMAAAQVIEEGLVQWLESEPDPPEQDDQQGQQQGAQQQIDDIRQDVKDQGGQATPQQVQALKDAIAQRNAAEDALGAGAPAPGPAGKIAAQAAAAGKEAADLGGLLPGQGSVEGTGLTAAETFDMIEQIRKSPNLEELLKLMGGLEREFRYARRQRVLDAPGEIMGIKHSSDVSKLLPYEMTLMTHPVLRLEFMRKYSQHSLLTYETEGEQEAGQGPLVICRDNSGSMSSDDFLWATAVALAMIRNANRERRDAALIDFDDGFKPALVYPKAKRVGIPEIITASRRRLRGGTSFEGVLNEAARFAEGVTEFRQGDVVLICDGLGRIDPPSPGSACERLKSAGMRVHCIYIGGGSAPAALGNIADRTDGSVCSVNDLQDTTEVRGVATALA